MTATGRMMVRLFVAGCALIPIICIFRTVKLTLPFRSPYRSGVEVSVSPDSSTTLGLSTVPGRYEVSIGCAIEGLPHDVKESGFAPETFQGISWDASLVVSNGTNTFLEANHLLLKSGFAVGRKQYYRLGVFEMGKPGLVEVQLTPRARFPFGSTPSLDIRPRVTQHSDSSWFWWNVVALLVCCAIFLRGLWIFWDKDMAKSRNRL